MLRGLLRCLVHTQPEQTLCDITIDQLSYRNQHLFTSHAARSCSYYELAA